MRIAISGLSGCGNTTVSKLVAEKTGFTRYNYTLRDLAAEIGADLMDLQEKAGANQGIDMQLDAKQLEFVKTHENCVVATRLAIWMDDPNIANKIGAETVKIGFKVWLDASLEERSRRVAQREKIPLEEAQKEVIARDLDNAVRYKKFYGIDVSRHSFADLVIDSEELTAEEVSQKIVLALDGKK